MLDDEDELSPSDTPDGSFGTLPNDFQTKSKYSKMGSVINKASTSNILGAESFYS